MNFCIEYINDGINSVFQKFYVFRSGKQALCHIELRVDIQYRNLLLMLSCEAVCDI